MIKLIIEQFDFSAGLVTTFGPQHTPRNGLYKCQNAMVHLGGFRRIYGTTKLNSVKIGDLAVVSLYRAYGNTVNHTFAVAGTGLYWNNAGTWTAVAGVTLTTGLPMSFVMYNGIVYCTNGTDTPLKITMAATPTAANMTGPATKCKQFIVARERLWAAVNSTNPDRVWYCSVNASGIGQPETWDANNYLPFPAESANEKVIGMAAWNNTPIIFTENSISALQGNNDFEFETPIFENRVGCLARNSIQSLAGGLIFLGRRGIYFWAGGTAHLLSEDILPEILDINQTYIENAAAISDVDSYYISYTSTAAGGTVNNRTLVFDTRIGRVQDGIVKGGWTGPHIIGAASMTYFYGSADTGQLYYGDATATGFVHQFMVSTATDFSGSVIDTDVVSKDIDFTEVGADIDREKKYGELIPICEQETSGTYTISYYLNNSSTETTFPSSEGSVSLAASGKQEGYKDTTTNSSRTIIIHPIKFEDSNGTAIIGWFVRIRFRMNATGSTGKIRGYKLTAAYSKPERS